MNILVLGYGYLGCNIAQGLAKNEKYRITVYSRSIPELPKLPKLSLNFIKGDIKDYEKVGKIIKKSDVIIYAVGISGIENVMANEYEARQGIDDVYEVCKMCNDKQHFIYLSSSSVNNGNPLSLYGEIQQSIEEHIFKFCNFMQHPFSILRIFSPWSIDQPNNMLIGRFLKLAKKGDYLEIWGDGMKIRDFIHIDDIVRLLNLYVEQFANIAILDVGTGVGTKVMDVANMISKRQKFIPDPRKGLEAQVKIVSKESLNKLKLMCNWEPTIFIKDVLPEYVKKYI